VVPWEAFYFGRGAKPGQPSPFKWTDCFCFGTDTFAKTYLSMWPQIETNKKVGVMYPNDADGNAIRGALAPLLAKGGYTIVDPGPYEDGTTDYSSQIQKFKDEGVEIFNTFPIPPDFAAFWRQAAQQGLTKQIKIAQIAKTGLFPSDVEALGDLGDKLATAAYWHPTYPYSSPLANLTSQQIGDGYTAATGKQWQQQVGASMSLLDAGFAALAAASNPGDKASLAKAISTLNTTTTVGKVDFTSGPVANVSETPIIGAQWVKATAGSKFQFDLVIVENATDPKVPIAAKLQPYNA
jgi:branched-chain amino acid transport system substrate-binding protein